MADAGIAADIGLFEKIRRHRRNFIKKTGKRFIRRLGSFLGKQSKVGDMPVFPTKNFEWAVSLETKADVIRQELLGILKRQEIGRAHV